ncbi:type II toxin-antitoxin system HipA family toxin [Amantichitinum ursilacus]|uniref:Putative DNA-binding transcriptional regulator n=1 Tax=Amantichitinum ursilacus TaxID=857265 RepID=A0A0N0XM54_9NEIS|nr:HipA domain-containing protein [Amantichitinum ursilacus]KPC54728.1 putative DNA-binding transcriptional regulator [Amantichitinum ursilacus]
MKQPKERTRYEVYLDAPELGDLQSVGLLHPNDKQAALASFEYDQAWIRSGRAFMLDPHLDLYPGEQYPRADHPAFGVFMDSAPDRWGRVLMERREAALAKAEGRPIRVLRDIDFLLGVYDHTRMGALRFKTPGAEAPFIDDSKNAAPPASSLAELAQISAKVEDDGVEQLPEYERWLAMLIAPGSSLGGARPKANFTDEAGRLWIAKFPAKEDRYDVGGWEFITHLLARKAGIDMADAKALKLTERYTTFCAARFDRTGTGRRMYASAMTLLQWQDGRPGASYLDIAEFIADSGAAGHIDKDLEQLFRRVVFNVLVGNRDDHLRNHGFIRVESGWRLSPAFDINPNRSKAEHALALDDHDASPDMQTVLNTAQYYRLDNPAAQKICDEVGTVIADWRNQARGLGLPSFEIEQMASVIKA